MMSRMYPDISSVIILTSSIRCIQKSFLECYNLDQRHPAVAAITAPKSAYPTYSTFIFVHTRYSGHAYVLMTTGLEWVSATCDNGMSFANS